jgi:hypothetical protein
VIEDEITRRLHSDLCANFCVSVSRRILVETENPSACATVDWKVCK